MQMIFDVTHITSQSEQIKNYIRLLKQNKKYFSEQIKLNTFSMRKKNKPPPIAE